MTQLHLDLGSPTTAIEPVWSFGANACHAPLLLRKDVQRHLLMCRDELGLRHVRCHGMLSDAMSVLRPDGLFDFTRVEEALDMLMGHGLMPVLELSAMPKSLAQGEGSGGGPPKDWGRWHELVNALATHIDGRYGCDARQWYFEVGGRPDDGSWAGTPAEYFRLYDVAARAIKEAHHEYRVGGPATGDPAGLDAFLEHVSRPSEDFRLDAPRCDFVSVHAASGGATAMSEARRKVSAALGANVPLICTEWSNPAGPFSFAHDACNNAALVAKTTVELAGVCQGALFRNLSDIADLAGQRHEPFHGGYGLVTVNDVRKSSFNAFRLLSEHASYHTQRLPVRWTDPIAGVGCLVTRGENTLRLLAWHYQEPDAPRAPTASFTLEGLLTTVRYAQVEVIRPGAGSAFETWVELGHPSFVNREVLEALETESRPAVAEVDFREYPPRLEPGMVMQLTVQLPWEEDRQV